MGRRLGIDELKLTALSKTNETYSEKAYQMVLAWKQREGVNTTYQVLSEALRHEFVGLNDLAEQYCK